MKAVLALQLDEDWDTSVTEQPGAWAPCQAGLAASVPRSRLFFGNVYVIQLCCCWIHGQKEKEKYLSKKPWQYRKHPAPQLPAHQWFPLSFCLPIKHWYSFVLLGPEGWRELEGCLCCSQCFLMMCLTRENELVCLRIPTPCGAQFGKLKIWEGK